MPSTRSAAFGGRPVPGLTPAGPTVLDEIANAALWLGLVKGLEQEVADIRPLMSFNAAHANFLNAARLGLDAQLEWLGRTQPAAELIN